MRADDKSNRFLWQFKPWSGTLLLKGYHPLAGGLLDDTTPLTWTKVHVYLKEPNVIVIKHLDEQRGSSQVSQRNRDFNRRPEGVEDHALDCTNESHDTIGTFVAV